MWKFLKGFARKETGGISGPFVMLITGVVFLVVGLILGQTVVTQAATAVTGIGSFAGATAMKDMIPFIYYALLVVISAGMIGWGALQLAKGNE